MALSDDEIQALEERANDIRKSIIEMLGDCYGSDRWPA